MGRQGTFLTNKQSERRQPAQARSKKRVDAILGAAKRLISEKGSARLKINDIAETADVTPASIYQYFPNKNAIILALAEQTFDQMHTLLLQDLADHRPDSEVQVYQVLRELVEKYYQVYLDDPALYDVWVSISADKSIQTMDIADSRRIADLVLEAIKYYYPSSHWAQIQQMSFLLAHLSGSAVRMAVLLGPEEGRTVIDNFKAIINATFVESMLGEQQGAGLV